MYLIMKKLVVLFIKKSTIATLQMVDHICDVALFLSDEEIKSMSWSTFVAGCQAPELIQYLKEQWLYVNNVISAEEEI